MKYIKYFENSNWRNIPSIQNDILDILRELEDSVCDTQVVMYDKHASIFLFDFRFRNSSNNTNSLVWDSLCFLKNYLDSQDIKINHLSVYYDDGSSKMSLNDIFKEDIMNNIDNLLNRKIELEEVRISIIF